MPQKEVYLYSTDPYVEKELVIFQLKKNLEMLASNYEELIQQFHNFHDPSTMKRVWNFSNVSELDEMIYELSRKLLNFIAMAKAVVEVNRITIRKKFSRTDFMKEYQDKIDELFTNNMLVGFLEDLRNYSLHYKILIPVVKPLGGAQEDGNDKFPQILDSFPLLKLSELLKWKDWRKGKEYLKLSKDNIDIEKLVIEYHDLIQIFYRWLFNSLEKMEW